VNLQPRYYGNHSTLFGSVVQSSNNSRHYGNKDRPMALLRHSQFRDMFEQQINLYIKSVSLRRMLIAKMAFIMGILLPSG
jgi:hypothetical protein